MLASKVPAGAPRVLHLEMPRALTTTLKAFDFRVAHALDAVGIELDGADLNVHFWSFVLGLAEDVRIDLLELFPPRVSRSSVERLCRAIEDFNGRFGLELTPFGLSFGSPAQTSLLARAAGHPGLERLVEEYLGSLADPLELGASNLAVVSLGISSADALVFACAFAAAVRRRVPECRIVLGKHGYENFSLKLRADAIRKNGHLDRWFDHVVFHEELLAAELASICGRATSPLVKKRETPDRPVAAEDLRPLFDRARYLRMIPIPLERCAYFTPLSRNECYWKKCTFCIQIEKHLSDRHWQESRELDYAFAELEVLAGAGLRYVIFDDEAIPPANLRRLCDVLEERPLPLTWTARIIADAKFDLELVDRMARAGCVEVLFGLETVREETARDMGKVSFRAGEAALFGLLQAFAERRIGIFLNVIYAFPTESDDEFRERTLPFVTRARSELAGLTTQFNRFSLFYGTTIDREPERFGVRKLAATPEDDDLRLVMPYEDRFGRRHDTPPNEAYFAASLGMALEEYAAAARRRDEELVHTLFQLRYASFGFIHKAETRQDLLHDVLGAS